MVRRLTVLAAASLALVVVGIAGAVGELAQKPGTAACVSETGTSGACQDGTALTAAVRVAVSPDGKSVYTASWLSDAIAVFDRDLTTGALTQKSGTAGCVSETGTGGACQDGIALGDTFAVEASADGKSVYVASDGSNAVAILDRDPATGALTQKSGIAGCISETGTGGACLDGKALGRAHAVAASADGKSVYIASIDSSAVAVLDREPTTGVLNPKLSLSGCVSEDGTGGACQDGKALLGASDVAASADGRSVYVISFFSNAVAIFDRDPATGSLTQKAGTAGCISETSTGGECQDGKALNVPTAVAASADGTSVYVASTSGVAIFDRDPSTGALAQKPGTAGCVSESGTGGDCQDGTALSGLEGVGVSTDNTSVYAPGSDAVAIFDRDPSTGALTQKSGTAGCVSETGAGPCQDGTALDRASDVAATADGKNVYVAAQNSHAVAIFDRATPPPATPPPAPPPGPPPAPPAPPARDTVAPTVTGFAVSPGRFRRSRGSRFRFRLSERANAGILLERTLPGRRVGRRCVAPSRRNRGRSRCTRFLRARTLTFRNRPGGANNLAFRTRALRLGSYRATITARDPAGNRSRPRRAAFRVIRR